jgi:hypothetical protein
MKQKTKNLFSDTAETRGISRHVMMGGGGGRIVRLKGFVSVKAQQEWTKCLGEKNFIPAQGDVQTLVTKPSFSA